MTANNSQWSNEAISDATLNKTTHGSGTKAVRLLVTARWDAERPFMDTDKKTLYTNVHATPSTNTTWRGISGLDIIDDHRAVGTESTYSFSPVPVLDFDTTTAIGTQYSAIIVEFDLIATAAFNLLCRINNDSVASYNSAGYSATSATLTARTPAAAATSWQLSGDGAANIAFTAANTVGSGSIEFRLSGSAGAGRIGAKSSLQDNALVRQEMIHNKTVTYTTLTKIELLTNTSTWAIGSHITTYGRKRL